MGNSEAPCVTRARTIGAFLAERKVNLGADDYISASPDTAVVDGMRVVYRPAVSVQLVVDKLQRAVRSAATTVGAFLTAQHVALGHNDVVTPSLAAPLRAGDTIRVLRVTAWDVKQLRPIDPPIVKHPDPELMRGTSSTIEAGSAGLREVTLRVMRPYGERLQRVVLGSRIVRAPHPTIIAIGTAQSMFADFAYDNLSQAVHLAGTALHMIATAYTAGCYGCSGITALGLHAGHGIVAVDPSVIPLGTRLYVPGYGKAVAGDTGGAIRGRRIDLGFNSLADALRFGRREITVYVLR